MRNLYLIIASACLLASTLNAFIDFGGHHQGNDNQSMIDSKMTKLRKDGRDPDTMSVFEEMRQKLEESQEAANSGFYNGHPMLAKHGENIDVQMDMLWDLNHVIDLKLTNESLDIQLIPSTDMEDLILLHNECRGCWTMHG